MVIDLVYVMALQAKPSAELLSPFGQTLLTNAYQDRPVVGHHGHAHLEHGALQTFVAYLMRTACHQGRNVTFEPDAVLVPAVLGLTGQTSPQAVAAIQRLRTVALQ